MFGPYRTPPDLSHVEASRPQEEVVLGWALVALGGLRVAIAAATGEAWSGEATVAALMVAFGAQLLLRR